MSSPAPPRPLVLVIRDGWGRNPHPEHDLFNAVVQARTPRCDAFMRQYPWTLIKTSGSAVGLPKGTMGNSEVGHQNIGAGRIVNQESVRVTKAIASGEFFENDVLVEAIGRPGHIHLMGIASDAGVHGLLTHLYACLALCERHHRQAFVHLFTDGRDTGPFAGKKYVGQIERECRRLGSGTIASVCGRYYAMDRDNRWERVARAYDMLTGRDPHLPAFVDADSAIQDYYDHPTDERQQGDEFITPRYVGDASSGRIREDDSVIFYNYRGDRPREITRAFVCPDFPGNMSPSPESDERGFDRGPKLDLYYVTMTAYEQDLNDLVRVAFAKRPPMEDIAGAFLARLGYRQFRTAETEKFAHVTFFFNDYREASFTGEARQMAPSPKVSTYDLQPQMSARELTDIVLGRLAAHDCEEFILVNFANGDMVGHTGNLAAAIDAVETVDTYVGRIVDAALDRGGALIVTADHGNAEQMFDPDTDAPHTAHTTYDVECIIVDPRHRAWATGTPARPSPQLRQAGLLADIMPTVLELMGLEQPSAMEGQSLLLSGER